MTTDQKINLMSIIDKTINRLKLNEHKYEWSQQHTCNCGFLAQTVLGKSEKQIESIFEEAFLMKIRGDWTQMLKSKDYCSQTGLELATVFDELFKLGLTDKDLSQLEYCNNPDILREMGFTTRQVKQEEKNEDPEFVRAYLKAWKDILEREVVCPIE